MCHVGSGLPAIWHLEQAVLSLERHHGVRAGRRRLGVVPHGRVWKVARERHESARGVVEADTN